MLTAILVASSLLIGGDITELIIPEIRPRTGVRFLGDVSFMPKWVFDDPKGDNALTTVTSINGEELTRQVQYFRRFSPLHSKYEGRTSKMFVARTQKEFDFIVKKMISANMRFPKLNFEKELFIFVFAGTKGANMKTLVEVAEIDRNEGPIVKPDFVIDHCIVRVSIDHQIIGEQKGFSPWTMFRVNKETFFAKHSMTADTKFIMIENRSYTSVKGEVSVGK